MATQAQQTHAILDLTDASAQETLIATTSKYPVTVQHQYGTAGFRAQAQTLTHVMFRVGVLAALRSTMFQAKHQQQVQR